MVAREHVRLAIAIGVIAVALAGAVFIHQRHTYISYCPSTEPGYCSGADPINLLTRPQHPSWEDPVAVLIGLGGIAVAVGIAYRPRRSG